MNDEPDDPLPQMVANIDQLIANAPHMARAAWGLYNAFAMQGFSSDAALYLTAVQLVQTPGEAP